MNPMNPMNPIFSATVLLAGLLIGPLAEAQDKKEQPAPKLTLIKNVKIFDGKNEELKDGPILIEGM